jgi:uncharacterized protein YjaG (DUF416 family)
LREYDEPGLVARLGALDRRDKTAFAAACAERVFPAFERYALSVGQPANAGSLRSVLDDVWAAISGVAVDLVGQQVLAEDLVPDDEGVWTHEMGYGQNGAAATAYAVRTWLTDDPQEAGWAARQVYELADYAVVSGDLDAAGGKSLPESDVRASAIVQEALRAIEVDLGRVEGDLGDSIRLVRRTVRAEGLAWCQELL